MMALDTKSDTTIVTYHGSVVEFRNNCPLTVKQTNEVHVEDAEVVFVDGDAVWARPLTDLDLEVVRFNIKQKARKLKPFNDTTQGYASMEVHVPYNSSLIVVSNQLNAYLQQAFVRFKVDISSLRYTVHKFDNQGHRYLFLINYVKAKR